MGQVDCEAHSDPDCVGYVDGDVPTCDVSASREHGVPSEGNRALVDAGPFCAGSESASKVLGVLMGQDNCEVHSGPVCVGYVDATVSACWLKLSQPRVRCESTGAN